MEGDSEGTLFAEQGADVCRDCHRSEACYVLLSVYLAQHSRGSKKKIRLDLPSKIMHRETDSNRTMLSLVHEFESEVLVELPLFDELIGTEAEIVVDILEGREEKNFHIHKMI